MANAKRTGQIVGMIAWPALAALSVWQAVNGLPSAVTTGLSYLLWAFAILLLLLTVVAAFVRGLGKPAETEAETGLDSRFAMIVLPSRLVLIVALFAGGQALLAACLAIGTVGLAVFKRRGW